jgi:hypothetical protein
MPTQRTFTAYKTWRPARSEGRKCTAAMSMENMSNKTEIPWRTDEAGMLLGARVHDGQITDLSYSKGLLSFRLERQSGSIILLELNGITELNSIFWEGTIVSEFFVWKISSSTEQVSLGLASAWEFLYRQRVVDLELEVKRAVKKRSESYLVHILCSYGGEFAAICNRVSIYEER